jgi:hypothetical protein
MMLIIINIIILNMTGSSILELLRTLSSTNNRNTIKINTSKTSKTSQGSHIVVRKPRSYSKSR